MGAFSWRSWQAYIVHELHFDEAQANGQTSSPAVLCSANSTHLYFGMGIGFDRADSKS